MDKQEWIARFIAKMVSYEIEESFAKYCAEANYENIEHLDGLTPEEAVDEEISCWSD